MNARKIIEAEASEWIETWQKLGPAAAKRMDATWLMFKAHDPNYKTWTEMGLLKDQNASFTLGSIQYEKRDGEWYRLKRTKNPAYWDQPRYFFIAPGPEKLAFVAVKQPRRLTAKLWHRASSQIWRDATGLSWWKDHPVLDGMEEDTWNRCATGKRREPAYEIFIDGTWKKVSK